MIKLTLAIVIVAVAIIVAPSSWGKDKDSRAQSLGITVDARWTGPVKSVSSTAMETPTGEIFKITPQTKVCDESGKAIGRERLQSGTKCAVALKHESAKTYRALAIQLAAFP